MKNVVLIIDDDRKKIDNIIEVNNRLRFPIILKESKRFEAHFNDVAARNNFSAFFEKTLQIIKEELAEDYRIGTVLLDLDITGIQRLEFPFNILNQMRENKRFLSDCFSQWSPYLVVWTSHSLSTFGRGGNEEIAWHELLIQHGVDLIVDDSRDAESLVRTLNYRIHSLEKKTRQVEERHARAYRRNVEIFPSVIMFTDMENFTGLFGRFHDDPGKIASLVDDALSISGDSTSQYGGVVHKYIGDAMMAYFPREKVYYGDEHYNQAVLGAVLAAVRVQEVVMLRKEDVNRDIRALWSGKGNADHNDAQPKEKPLFVNIGIAGGHEIIWGTFGYHHFKEFTLIGDPVNRAARYQGKAVHGAILMDSQIGKYLCTFQDVIELSNSVPGNCIEDEWDWEDIKNSANQTDNQIDIQKKIKDTQDKEKLPLIRCKTKIKIGGVEEEREVYAILSNTWSHKSEKEREASFQWKK